MCDFRECYNAYHDIKWQELSIIHRFITLFCIGLIYEHPARLRRVGLCRRPSVIKAEWERLEKQYGTTVGEGQAYVWTQNHTFWWDKEIKSYVKNY